MTSPSITPTLDRFAELVGRTRQEIREALVLAGAEKGIPRSGILNIHVRVPTTGGRSGPVRPGSMIDRTAKHLHLDPSELQEALLALRPDAPPGSSATFGIRAQSSVRDLIIPNFQDALDDAYFGNQWAVRWLELARRIIHDLPLD